MLYLIRQLGPSYAFPCSNDTEFMIIYIIKSDMNNILFVFIKTTDILTLFLHHYEQVSNTFAYLSYKSEVMYRFYSIGV